MDRFSLAPLAGRGSGRGGLSTDSTRGESPAPGSSHSDDPTSPRKRGEVKNPRIDALNRPVLGRDGGGIGADDFGQRIASGAQQRRRQIVLDVVDQAKDPVDQRRIELDQAGAGADF